MVSRRAVLAGASGVLGGLSGCLGFTGTCGTEGSWSLAVTAESVVMSPGTTRSVRIEAAPIGAIRIRARSDALSVDLEATRVSPHAHLGRGFVWFEWEYGRCVSAVLLTPITVASDAPPGDHRYDVRVSNRRRSSFTFPQHVTVSDE